MITYKLFIYVATGDPVVMVLTGEEHGKVKRRARQR